MRSLPSLLIVVLNKLAAQHLNGSWLNFNPLHPGLTGRGSGREKVSVTASPL